MTGSLYEEVQHFYGRQMRHLDEGAVVKWAQTFTEDGVFAANARPHPQEGRASIERGAREAAARLAATGVQHRHWLGMLEVAEQPDGSVLAKTYALIIATPKGGAAAVHLSTSCEDHLVRVDGELRVRHRQIRRDDLPAA